MAKKKIIKYRNPTSIFEMDNILYAYIIKNLYTSRKKKKSYMYLVHKKTVKFRVITQNGNDRYYCTRTASSKEFTYIVYLQYVQKPNSTTGKIFQPLLPRNYETIMCRYYDFMSLYYEKKHHKSKKTLRLPPENGLMQRIKGCLSIWRL